MKFRTDSAAQYLKVLKSSLQIGWVESFKCEHKSEFEQLALLHPYHLADLDLPRHLTVESIQLSVQGTRAFGPSLAGLACQSPLLWDYECELNGEMHQDHLFPYSLGGPTLRTNRIYLCRYHNMVKSSDIHCYPWESFDRWAGPWLPRQIERLHKEIFSLYG